MIRFITRTATRSAILLTLVFSLPAHASQIECNWSSPTQRLIVAELYTSEGCSSCPPADRWLESQLTSEEVSSNILALSFHVDYWNYIGWEDPYSSKQFTQRQYEHKRAGHVSQIYTPQFVFSNREVRRWGQAGLIPRQLAAMKTDKAPIGLHMSLERKSASKVKIQVDTEWLDDRYDSGVMSVVLFEDKLAQRVTAGENKGELLQHSRVVRQLIKPAQVSNSRRTHVVEINIPEQWKQQNTGIGVIVENRESGTILQALNAPNALGKCQSS